MDIRTQPKNNYSTYPINQDTSIPDPHTRTTSNVKEQATYKSINTYTGGSGAHTTHTTHLVHASTIHATWRRCRKRSNKAACAEVVEPDTGSAIHQDRGGETSKENARIHAEKRRKGARSPGALIKAPGLTTVLRE